MEEEELKCTCDEDCCLPCKGGCGCKKCGRDWDDFLSLE